MTTITEEEIKRKYAPYGDMILVNMNHTYARVDENGSLMFHEDDVVNAFERLNRINKM